MSVLRVIHSAIFWFLIVVYSCIIYTITHVPAFFMRNEEKKRNFFHKTGIIWGRLILATSLVRVKVSGLENIPKDTNVIFTPNHQSFLDIFILLKYLPYPYKFIIMRKLFNVPLLGIHITKCGFFSLDRKDRKKSVSTIHKIVEEIKEGWSFIIFPEGKLTKDGKVGEFGRGSSIIIQYARKPVVPVAISGTFGVWPKGSWILNPQEVAVKIGKPVKFEEYTEHINKETSLELGKKLRDIVVALKEK